MNTNDASDGIIAGGWCAPSETVYQMGDDPTLTPGEMFNVDGDLVTSMKPTVREMLAGKRRRAELWAGTADPEPTDEEKRIVVEWMHRQYVAELEQWQETQHFLGKVKRHKFVGLAAEIMGLHANEDTACAVCTDEWTGSNHTWPCATVRLVLDAHGIDVPEELVYDKPVEPTPDPGNPRWPFPALPANPLDFITFPEVSTARGGLKFRSGQ